MRDNNDPELKVEEENMKIYKRLTECLKTIGNNKIGTETYMPIESILHHKLQSYNSDIWPVGVILLQFIARKYNIFNNVRMINKPSGVRNTYFINYIIQLATFFGDHINDQCRKLGYELKLPKDIEKLSFRDIACMYSFFNSDKTTTTRWMTC
jgi:cell division control protein 7